MPKPEQIPIQRHMDLDELNMRIRRLKKDIKVLKRLYFIKCRYEGEKVEVSARRVGITKSEGYIWQKRWNRAGYAGIILRYVGGRPPKLSEQQKEQLKALLKQRDNWTTSEVRDCIRGAFDVDYTLKQIRVILKKFGMNYAKPYAHDYGDLRTQKNV